MLWVIQKLINVLIIGGLTNFYVKNFVVKHLY